MEAILSENNKKLNVIRYAKTGSGNTSSYLIENHAFVHVDQLGGDFDNTHNNYFTDVVGITGPWFLLSFSNPLYDYGVPGPKDVYSKPVRTGIVVLESQDAMEQDILANVPLAMRGLNRWKQEIFRIRGS